MPITAGINVALKIPFFVTDVDGISAHAGLVDGDFSKALIANGATSAQPVTVVEIGSGHYYATFTPNVEGLWAVYITTPAQDILVEQVRAGEYDPTEVVAVLRKTALNRLEVDLTAQELVLYGDDGSTVVQRWPLETDDGDPVLTQPGVQTKRKAPLLP